MSSSTEVVLWTIVRKVDWGAIMVEGRVLPRYAQFGYPKEYVGLRESPEDAWTSRVLSVDADARPEDFFLVKVVFTPPGFVHFSTEMYRSGLPRFHKVVYAGGGEYGAWRFYGGIPISADDPATFVPFLRLELIADWDYYLSSHDSAAAVIA
jgi:hypothetical protein